MKPFNTQVFYNMSIGSQRIEWIDRMKVIGMYFIVAGHLNPIGAEYIYTFSVQLFFIISGFLSRKTSDHKLFWSKLFNHLIRPMIIICILQGIVSALSGLYSHRLETYTYLYIPLNIILGNWSDHNVIGLGVMWFVYTLVIIKIVYEYTSQRIQLFIIIPLCIILSVLLKEYSLEFRNAWVNTLMAFPVFIMGHYLAKFKAIINESKIPLSLGCLLGIYLIAVIFIITQLNGEIRVFKNSYGNDFSLYLLGGFAGTGLVFIISKQFNLCSSRIIRELSIGNIFTLGIHPMIINIYCRFRLSTPGIEYLIALIIMALMIPLIRVSYHFFPQILGLDINKEKI